MNSVTGLQIESIEPIIALAPNLSEIIIHFILLFFPDVSLQLCFTMYLGMKLENGTGFLMKF